MYDVISIGAATLDIFVKSNQFKVVEDKNYPSGQALCEAYGAKIEVEDVHLATGGGGTNSAVSFARKGLKAACIAEIGQDLAGTTVLHELSKEGVDTGMMIQESRETTGISVIMIAPEGGRSIITCRGAAGMLEVKDVQWDKLQTKWLYITSLGGQMELLAKLVSNACDKGIKVALNPGQKELEQGDKIRELGQQVDVLIMNVEEAEAYLGVHAGIPIDQLLQQIQTQGGRITLVTNGPQGAYILTKDKKWFCPPSGQPPVQQTGAGDAFGSGFVTGQILGWEIDKSAQLAVANAGSVIQKFGAKEGLISLTDFENMKDENVVLRLFTSV